MPLFEVRKTKRLNQSNDSMAALVEGAAKDFTNKAPVKPV
jgi:hypothetical protein